MHLRIDIHRAGLHPNQRSLVVRDFDGREHYVLHSVDAIRNRTIDIGHPSGRDGRGALLVDLGVETDQGLHRIWVARSQLVTDPEDADGGTVLLAPTMLAIGADLALVDLLCLDPDSGSVRATSMATPKSEIVDGKLRAQGPTGMKDGYYRFVVNAASGDGVVWAPIDAVVSAGMARDAALREHGDIREHFKGGVYRFLRQEGGEAVYEHLWPNAIAEHRRPMAEFFGRVADGERFRKLAA